MIGVRNGDEELGADVQRDHGHVLGKMKRGNEKGGNEKGGIKFQCLV